MSIYSLFGRELNAWEVAYLSFFALLLLIIFTAELRRMLAAWWRWREEQRRMRDMTNLEALTMEQLEQRADSLWRLGKYGATVPPESTNEWMSIALEKWRRSKVLSTQQKARMLRAGREEN